jgi:hypothetical protein
MWIELCQSSTSASEMWAKTPRLDASLTKSGSGAWSRTITGQAASLTIFERVRGGWPEPDERDVGSFAGGHGTDVLDVDLARDHLVPEGHDERRDQRQTVLALVGDQHAQMLGLTVAHSQLRSRGESRSRAGRFATPADGFGTACTMRVRFASILGGRWCFRLQHSAGVGGSISTVTARRTCQECLSWIRSLVSASLVAALLSAAASFALRARGEAGIPVNARR